MQSIKPALHMYTVRTDWLF